MDEPRVDRSGLERLNALALLFAAGVLAALGLAWWGDHMRAFERPGWGRERFVALSPECSLAGGERWVVAVNLRCPHCRAHLTSLARRIGGRPRPPALSALIVDQPTRPARADLGTPLAGGVWWDSAQVWREGWGRRAYGETFRFDERGRLLSATPAGVLPDSESLRM